jgi:hypothetical protein
MRGAPLLFFLFLLIFPAASSAETLECETLGQTLGEMSHFLTAEFESGKLKRISYTGSRKLEEDGLAYNCGFEAAADGKEMSWKDADGHVEIFGTEEEERPDRVLVDYSSQKVDVHLEGLNHSLHCGQAAEPPPKITVVKGKKSCTVNAAEQISTTPVKALDQVGFALMGKESLGTLKLGLPESTVSSMFPMKATKGKVEFWEGDGLYHQEWKFSSLGISLNFSFDSKNGQKTLWSITATHPCKLKTQRGIYIGSGENETLAAYQAEYNKEDSVQRESIVAGTTYGGLSFLIKDHRVSQIFIGSASE